MSHAQDAYRQALADHDELGGRLDAYRSKAAALRVADVSDVARAYAMAREALDRRPVPDGAGSAAGRPLPDLRAAHGDFMTPCTQPGCTGTIVDGYCDVCGLPPNAPATPVAAAPGATACGAARPAAGRTGLGCGGPSPPGPRAPAG